MRDSQFTIKTIEYNGGLTQWVGQSFTCILTTTQESSKSTLQVLINRQSWKKEAAYLFSELAS